MKRPEMCSYVVGWQPEQLACGWLQHVPIASAATTHPRFWPPLFGSLTKVTECTGPTFSAKAFS